MRPVARWRRPVGVFFLIFILVELLYRSIELMAVDASWVPGLLTERDPARRLALEILIAAFDEAVHAWYFVLIGSQLLGSLLFAASVFERSRWNAAVSGVFALNAARLASRMLEGYAGLTWLQPVNAAVYTPAVCLFFLTVALWLWRAGRVRTNE